LSSEEKSEALVECKEDLEHNKLLVAKLRQEVTCAPKFIYLSFHTAKVKTVLKQELCFVML